ncbi:MAG TPA: hypothetical protein VFA10_16520 [Ktedonobacteraceae bacterium]|jgi:hypothetical protein|nr:hypothetical protein [Ktedonobacteraceae bacterium]
MEGYEVVVPIRKMENSRQLIRGHGPVAVTIEGYLYETIHIGEVVEYTDRPLGPEREFALSPMDSLRETLALAVAQPTFL